MDLFPISFADDHQLAHTSGFFILAQYKIGGS